MARYLGLLWLAAVAVGAIGGALGAAYLSLTDWARTRHGIRRLEHHANQTNYSRKED